MVSSVYRTGLLPTDDATFMANITEFFATRLIKKGMRKDNPWEGVDELAECIEAFRSLIRVLVAADGAPVEAAWWEKACGELSFAHLSVSHWVCPVRLAEYLKEQGLAVNWQGEMNERKRTPPSDFLKKKVRRERDASQPTTYTCAYCAVTCNSVAQMHVHTSGSRHQLVVAQLTKKYGTLSPDFVKPVRERRRRRGRGSSSESGYDSSAGCTSETGSAPSPPERNNDMYTTNELENLLKNVAASLEATC